MDGMIQSPDGNRLVPRGRPSAYQTFSVHRPLATHWRKATCEEVHCPDFERGWRLRVEILDAAQLYDVEHCGRSYQRVQAAEGETWLVFKAGQPCFRASTHRIQVERDALFVLRGGDWRQLGDPVKLSPTSWVDAFGENQDKLRDEVEKG